MKRIAAAAITICLLAACSDTVDGPGGNRHLQDIGTDAGEDQGGDATTSDLDATAGDGGVTSSDLGDSGASTDTGAGDMPDDGDVGGDDGGTDASDDAGSMSPDMEPADMTTDLATIDMTGGDGGATDMPVDMNSTTDAADTSNSGGYDTTGWNMDQKVITGTASTGTPDSYFFDVDSGSPLSASITGGGNGTWSVNVYGGNTNHLYPCSGNALCQVMLDPADTVVVVTAITTDIGSYTLTVDYSGQGLR